MTNQFVPSSKRVYASYWAMSVWLASPLMFDVMREKMENENKDTYIELSKEEREKRKKELIKKLKS